MFSFASIAFCEVDYWKLYEESQPADFKLVHGIDPFQAQDYYEYAWAPYPLFRSSATLYYKDDAIPPGYYLLAPRTMKGRDYVFFKESGTVKYIIPVVKKELVPEMFYENRIPRPKKTRWETFCDNNSKRFHKLFKSSKKQPPPQSYIETHRIDSNLTLMILYYGNHKYYTLYKTKL